MPFGRRLGLLSVAALLLRVGYAVAFADRDQPSPDSDRFFFLEAPKLLANGEGFVHPFIQAIGFEDAATAGHPPGWIFLLTPVAKLGLLTPLSARLVGCAAGAVACLLIGLIARRVAGEAAGIAAAGIAAIYPTWVFADASGMPEALYLALVAAAVLALLNLRASDTQKGAIVLGLLVGLAGLTRTEGLLFLPLVVVPVLWRQWRAVAITAVAVAVTVGPWTIRNAIELQRFIPVSTNVDTVLAGANCQQTYFGRDTGLWSADCFAAATNFREGQARYDEGALAEGWRTSGTTFAQDHAARLPVVIAARIARLWRLWQPLREADLTEGVRPAAVTVGALSFLLLLLPAGALGAYAGGLARRDLIVFAALAFTVTAASALGWGAPRFLRPAELGLIVCAAALLAARSRPTAAAVR